VGAATSGSRNDWFGRERYPTASLTSGGSQPDGFRKIHDQCDQRLGKPAAAHPCQHGLDQTAEDRGKTFGRGGGWIGHADVLT
jgi:hypothetical protein